MMAADMNATAVEQQMPLDDVAEELTALVVVHVLRNGCQHARVPKPQHGRTAIGQVHIQPLPQRRAKGLDIERRDDPRDRMRGELELFDLLDQPGTGRLRINQPRAGIG